MQIQPVLQSSLLAAALLFGSAPASAVDLSNADLNGHWYILVHYKDDRSEDKSITKFRDAVWSIKQDENKVKINSYPYVFFSEGDELIRRNNMMNHVAWSPDERIWGEIREFVRVSDRGSKVKTLKGGEAQVFESNPGGGGGFGMNTLTFTQNWKLTFAPDSIRVDITDSLSGSGGLAGMDETITYLITERVSDDEFRGKYDDPTRHGKMWMVRSKQRLGQKVDSDKAAAAEEQRRSSFEEFMKSSD